ncbi:TetR/AcrR family transcriptional regulator [Subtercola endophyticus]|uniref:TetR/AcrR family transcriptional regulator n=1 Tax=Subtercola endophyticus TaxID=2895559 RepID=UPI001E6057FF|nr:TetR/AcrR family transcriptional regulator [Subtercola endophyticus]UFS60568.1 TetR/AcrR family transcriptional regulator [Subtercola endophyticus]
MGATNIDTTATPTATPTPTPTATATAADTDRRVRVLESALTTFARYGYRKTSMDQVANDADISRPGLYFLFTSKETIFRAAVTQALNNDLSAADAALSSDRALAERLLDAFDHWAGSYVGPLARDIAGVIDDNPRLLGDIVTTAPQRFEGLITQALASDRSPDRASALARTLISTSIGLKHQVDLRAEYRDRLRVALELLGL